MPPFLTDLDSRAAIKGSRDPLGVQPIWSRLGRRVVANLTTVSNSVRDFTVLLLGYYFAERVAQGGGTDGDLSTFLKWEQLAAYARAHVNGERGFRGTERVWKRLSEGDRVVLGAGLEFQILSNQKTYGLWGLYTMPSKASGLLEGDPTRLTAVARQLVERDLLPAMESKAPRAVQEIVDRLSRRTYSLDLAAGSRDATLLKAIGSLLKSVSFAERELYRDYLLYGCDGDKDPSRGTQGKQRLFADLLTETLQESDWALSPESIDALAAKAARRGPVGRTLVPRLQQIRAAESLLAPAAALFEYALKFDGQTPFQIATQIRSHWGKSLRQTIDMETIEALEPELGAGSDGPASGRRWVQLADAFRGARYEKALELLLAQNAAVMTARAASAAWAVVRDGKLHVRFRDERPTALPLATELPTYWRHAYFIESLRTVGDQLRAQR